MREFLLVIVERTGCNKSIESNKSFFEANQELKMNIAAEAHLHFLYKNKHSENKSFWMQNNVYVLLMHS